MLWKKLVLEKDDDPLVKKMKGLSVLVAIVLSLLLAEYSTSNEVVLTAWPQGQHFYLGESIVLTCRVKNNPLEVWIYSWFRHNISTAATPGAGHRINHRNYLISALTSEDSDMYWCAAQKQDANSTLWSNPVTINVTEASSSMTLEVRPNSSQHLRGEQFSLRCSVNNGKTANLTLRRLHDAEVRPGCSQTESPDRCSFNNITVEFSGLYWCETAGGDQRSNAILITVSENTFIGTAAWVWVVCVIIIILLLIPITILLVPCLRRRVKFLPTCGDFIRHQEMPRTKQDVTEIQWDLAWMEMSNLLDKPSPGS